MAEGYSELDGQILRCIERDSLSLDILIRYVGSDADNIRNAVDRLCKKGVLRGLQLHSSKGDPDVTVELTEEGKQVNEAFRVERGEVAAPVKPLAEVTKLDDTERAILEKLSNGMPMAPNVLSYQVVEESKSKPVKINREHAKAAIGRLTTKRLIRSPKDYDPSSLVITEKGMQALKPPVITEAIETPSSTTSPNAKANPNEDTDGIEPLNLGPPISSEQAELWRLEKEADENANLERLLLACYDASLATDKPYFDLEVAAKNAGFESTNAASRYILLLSNQGAIKFVIRGHAKVTAEGIEIVKRIRAEKVARRDAQETKTEEAVPVEKATEKYMVLKDTGPLTKWGTIVVPGTVIGRNDIDVPGIAPNRLISQGTIRVATVEEVAEFDKQFPKSEEEELTFAVEMAALKRSVEVRLANASSLSDYAALCLQLIRELGTYEAYLRTAHAAVFEEAIGQSEAQKLRSCVLIERRLRKRYAPYKLIKETIKPILESLTVGAAGLDDPQFDYTPLLKLSKHWDQQYLDQPNPAFRPAEEFLERLRPKLKSREQRDRATAVHVKSEHEKRREAFLRDGYIPTQHLPAINIQNVIHNNNTNSNINTNTVAAVPSEPVKRKGIFGISNAIISHPIPSGVIVILIAGFLLIYIYERWGFNLYDASSSWRHIFHSATQP